MLQSSGHRATERPLFIMNIFEFLFSATFAIILFIPIGIIIIIFYNSVFWYVGGLLKIKDPFWRIRIGGGIVLIIYTIILFKLGAF